MKILRIFFSLILVFCILFTMYCGGKKISYKKDVAISPEYKGIITLWNIDGFEGGVGSRKKFLLDVACTFEKKNKGVLIMVLNHTVESAKMNMENGIYPDMLSFSNGVNFNGVKELSFDTSFIGGKVGNKTFAVPWCRGGYVLISMQNAKEDIEEIIISENTFTQPLLALGLEETEYKKAIVLSPKEAYSKFLEGKVPYMVGTQRDVVKLSNRGTPINCKPLENYNDLYQYISVLTESDDKRYYCEEYIKYLISNDVQKQLSKLSLFSPYVNVEFDNENLRKMQNTELKSTISAFSSVELLTDLKEQSHKGINGDREYISKIKNVLLIP